MTTTTKKIETEARELAAATEAHDQATAAYKAAQDAYDAAPCDAAWAARKAAQEDAERTGATKAAAERRLAAAQAAEADRVRERERATDLATYKAHLRALDRVPEVIASHAANVIAAEAALAAALAEADADLATLAARRSEAAALESKLELESALPPAVSMARVRAAVAVADRQPAPFVLVDAAAAPRIGAPHMLLPRAPATARDRATFLCDLLGEAHFSATDEGEQVFPAEQRVAALLDGTYRAAKKAANEEVKARANALREATRARQEELDRQQYVKDQERRYGPAPTAETART